MTGLGRRPLVAGNWKMNTTVLEALNLTTLIRQRLGPDPLPEVVLLPPFISVWPVQQLLANDPRIAVGAQDCYWEKSGAFTGAVSAAMLVGSCRYVLVGHSERRRLFGDNDGVVRRKLESVLEAGLDPILAVGESWEERQSGRTDAVLEAQTQAGLAGLAQPQLLRCILAYEPVWAIGTGRTAVPEDVSTAIAQIREVIDD
ncbi:MAG: triose-phosphate isomerase, partial [Candidatus Dormiibacterota bacterium]